MTDDRADRGSDRSRAALAAAYATNFGALAAWGAFLALYLAGAGFSLEETGLWLAVASMVRVVAIPAFTMLADRGPGLGGVLRLASAGALAVFAAFFLGGSRAFIATALVVFSVFRAPFGALLDARLLRDARGSPSRFSATRAWGTAGFAGSALVAGWAVATWMIPGFLVLTALLLAGALGAALGIPATNDAPQERTSEGASWRALGALLARPRVVALFGIALLHEIGLSAYDNLFPVYLTSIAGAKLAGSAVALGGAAELLFFLSNARFGRRVRPERLLALAGAGSTARWLVVATCTAPFALVAVQALHALSFGAFYVASVVLMDRETPPDLRASGQGFFGAFTFGVAAAIGISIAGVIEQHAGLRAHFALASGAALVATVVTLLFGTNEKSVHRDV